MRRLGLVFVAMLAAAGPAVAEVSMGGDARMGVVHDGDAWTLANRLRVGFMLSGETDTGLSFGASIRADEALGGSQGIAGSVFVSGRFGTLTLGDVNSADQELIGNLHGVGLTGLGDAHKINYAAGGGISAGAFGMLGSMHQPHDARRAAAPGSRDLFDSFGIPDRHGVGPQPLR